MGIITGEEVVTETAVGYLPEDQRNTAYYIFSTDQRYLCRVPVMQTRSIEDIRFFGVPTTGDAAYDAEMANEKIVRRLTINQMVEYYKTGVTVGVINKKDTKLIYEKISDHLGYWSRLVTDSLNAPRAPIEDLITLDEFAHKVYEYAKWQFKTPYTQSLLRQRLNAGIHRSPYLMSKQLPNGKELSVENPPKERDPMNEIFASRRELMSLNQARSPNEERVPIGMREDSIPPWRK